MKTIDIIHDEHRALASVLQALRFVVGEIRSGKLQPDFRLLAAMVDYITQVPEKVHHPKEDDYFFPLLRARSAKASALIDQLEAQHRDGTRMTGELLQALIHYQSFEASGFAAFDALLQHYLDFNWQHLNLEEGELLPLAREALSEADWQALDTEFSANFDPFSGAEGEYETLFRRIVNMTPAPYGLGA
ncbi:MAG: hemerythrin cation binding protein [Proteobacteria bacterium]|nr:hemerythrin cation binding protein [Pseudomonadota bacterium]